MLLEDARSRVGELSVGFWFIAAVAALFGPLLAVALIAIDHAAGEAGVFAELVISPTSARTILSAIAGSLITIASLTSSLTIVTLQLLSNQYTPRAIRGFLGTRLSQSVFGTLIGVFIYCLLTLVVVRAPGEENDPFVPSLTVAVAIVLAVASLLLLVVFVHRMSQLIQVSTMTIGIARTTMAAIDVLHPDPVDEASPAERDPWNPADALEIRALRSGYITVVDGAALLGWVRREGAELQVIVRPGQAVTTRDVVAVVRTARLTDRQRTRLQAAIRIGNERDLDQDPTFGCRLVTDVALRALSPGINDPTTAITCLTSFRPVLELLASRATPTRRPLDGAGRVTVAAPDFEDYLTILAEIGAYTPGNARVAATLTRVLASVAAAADEATASQRAAAVRQMAVDIGAPARAAAETELDRQLLLAADRELQLEL